MVSKKVAKSAVERNKIRRRVYEAVRLNFDKIPKKTDYIFVVFKKEMIKMNFEELQEMILELVKESQIT